MLRRTAKEEHGLSINVDFVNKHSHVTCTGKEPHKVRLLCERGGKVIQLITVNGGPEIWGRKGEVVFAVCLNAHYY